jgi:hypothetical protein
MTVAIDRLREEVLRAFDNGRLGVMAATYNVPEGKLRDFCEGDNNALTVEQAVNLARALLPKEAT